MKENKEKNFSLDELIKQLQGRKKELNCLYTVEEIINTATNIDKALENIVEVIPKGWQYPKYCQVIIQHDGREYFSPNFHQSEWVLHSQIKVDSEIEGEISVYYTKQMPQEFEGPFLKEERKLLNNIADRIGKFIFHQKSRALVRELEETRERLAKKHRGEWRIIVDLLRKTDQELFLYVSRKMIYYLCWSGIKEAQELLQNFGTNQKLVHSEFAQDANKPSPKISFDMLNIALKIFDIAATYLSDEEILTNIQRWMKENRTNFLVRCLESRGTSLSEISDALRHFRHLMMNSHDLPLATQTTVHVSLASRIFSEQADFITTVKDFIDIDDIYELLKRTIYPMRSHGKLGGKSAGLFLASRAINKVKDEHPELQDISVPKTWYITSDGMQYFTYSNNFEEIVEQKYKPIERVRLEYPHVVQILKNSPFPPEILNGLSMALDDFGERPIVVRSSSLLEDRLGTTFSGKYKSLFLANQGTKEERMEALTDAIAEVYASLFSPDPIEYRAERELLDFHEEMGIMIQEVVGTKTGKYFLPAYAGVAFSNNEFRWSPRIDHKDGLIRLVPGLGTRAVDRVADDYPVLIAPGQPNLRVNVTLEEHIRYAPKKADVINLETNTFETIEYEALVREYGDQLPFITHVVSVIKDDLLVQPGFMTDFSKEESIVTFEGLRNSTRFVEQIHTVTKLLEGTMKTPVDIEFASDGKTLYLLQCRSQSSFLHSEAAPIPDDVPEERIIFSANKYVSNGNVSDITHLVYVDPEAYNNIETQPELQAVGRAIGKLNKLLPKRQFILIGPGRWGSRGDIKLGVHVTYADINNTAALIEVARKKGNYVPELSFGTHFFQDLVEASIRYLPLYPDSDGNLFNESFFVDSPNIFPHILPKYAYLSKAIKVIDIPGVTDGLVLRLAMNADLDKALAYLAGSRIGTETPPVPGVYEAEQTAEDHWRWRMRMAARIARRTDPGRFGVKGFYLIGSTKNRTAGPDSDIDLLLLVDGTDEQQKALEIWLEGWSLCLSEANYLRTGKKTKGLLHPHYVTNEDLVKKTSFARKIGAISDAAQKLSMLKKK